MTIQDVWFRVAAGTSFFKKGKYKCDDVYQHSISKETITLLTTEEAHAKLPDSCWSVNQLLAIKGVKLSR